MNLRTADRLRFAAHVLTLLFSACALTFAIAAYARVYRFETGQRVFNAKVLTTLYVMADALDNLLKPGNSAPPALPPLPLPTPENQFFRETQFEPKGEK